MLWQNYAPASLHASFDTFFYLSRRRVSNAAVLMSKKPEAAAVKAPHPQTQHILQGIRTVSDRLATAASAGQLKPPLKRQLKIVDTALASLEQVLASGQLNDSNVANQLIRLATAFHSSDFATATAIVKHLYKTDFHQHKAWLKGIQSLTRVASTFFR